MKLAWRFPALFIYIFTKFSFHNITSGPWHSGWDHPLCQDTHKNQANKSCLFRHPQGKFVQVSQLRSLLISSTWDTFPVSARVTCSTGEQALSLHPHGRTACAGTCQVSEEQKPLLSSEGQPSYPKSRYSRVSFSWRGGRPACLLCCLSPSRQGSVDNEEDSLQLILAASAC